MVYIAQDFRHSKIAMTQDDQASAPIKNGLYRHYKGGMYFVMGIAEHSETREQLVVYQALYGERGLWVRPLAMFMDTVEVGGETINRFEFEPSEELQSATTS